MVRIFLNFLGLVGFFTSYSALASMTCNEVLQTIPSQHEIVVEVVSNLREKTSYYTGAVAADDLIDRVRIISATDADLLINDLKIGDILDVIAVGYMDQYDRYFENGFDDREDRPVYITGDILVLESINDKDLRNALNRKFKTGDPIKYSLVFPKNYKEQEPKVEKPVAPEPERPVVTNRDDWDALDRDFQEGVINEYEDFEGQVRKEVSSFEGMDGFKKAAEEYTKKASKDGLSKTDKRQAQSIAQFILAAGKQVNQDVDTEIHDTGFDTYVTVGEVQITIEVILLPNGEVVGGEIYISQEGASVVEFDGELEELHFATAKEAEAAGADTGADVSWANRSVYLFDGDQVDDLGNEVHMDWTGH